MWISLTSLLQKLSRLVYKQSSNSGLRLFWLFFIWRTIVNQESLTTMQRWQIECLTLLSNITPLNVVNDPNWIINVHRSIYNYKRSYQSFKHISQKCYTHTQIKRQTVGHDQTIFTSNKKNESLKVYRLALIMQMNSKSHQMKNDSDN